MTYSLIAIAKEPMEAKAHSGRLNEASPRKSRAGVFVVRCSALKIPLAECLPICKDKKTEFAFFLPKVASFSKNNYLYEIK